VVCNIQGSAFGWWNRPHDSRKRKRRGVDGRRTRNGSRVAPTIFRIVWEKKIIMWKVGGRRGCMRAVGWIHGQSWCW
jgi:hypothetical protein